MLDPCLAAIIFSDVTPNKWTWRSYQSFDETYFIQKEDTPALGRQVLAETDVPISLGYYHQWKISDMGVTYEHHVLLLEKAFKSGVTDKLQ